MSKKKTKTLADGAYLKPITEKIGVLYYDKSVCSLKELNQVFLSVKESNIYEYFIVLPTSTTLEQMSLSDLETWIKNAQKIVEDKKGEKGNE